MYLRSFGVDHHLGNSWPRSAIAFAISDRDSCRLVSKHSY